MINVTKAQLPDIKKYEKYLSLLWKTAWITNDGSFTKELEKKLEDFLKVNNLVLTNNGTSALLLALKALDLKGEVITTPFTFPATTNALLWQGLTPVFADINPKTYNINPDDVEKKISNKTSAILAVHVYGNPCDVEKLEFISKKYNLKLIFDAAHAFGVEYRGKSILNYGDASILSFHATKIFNTIEGGAVVVKDKKNYKSLKLLRNFGILSEEKIVLPGINAKMNEFQAIMGLCNLEDIKKNILLRKKVYDLYKNELIKTTQVKFQEVIASKYNYAYMPIILKNKLQRDGVYHELIKNGVKPRKYFYPLLTNLKYIKKVTKKGNFPIGEKVSNSVLCLPIFPDLKNRDIYKIIKIISKFLKNH